MDTDIDTDVDIACFFSKQATGGESIAFQSSGVADEKGIWKALSI